MLENSCDGEGKLGEEDMAVGFVYARRLPTRARVGVEESTKVGVAAMLTERIMRRKKGLHVRIDVLLTTLPPYLRSFARSEVIHGLFGQLYHRYCHTNNGT